MWIINKGEKRGFNYMS